MEMVSKDKLCKQKVIGYLRVSTLSQELGKNKTEILSLANTFNLGKVTFVEEG
jgi:DNA invertase Pin-like site-specific DNA recombinase